MSAALSFAGGALDGSGFDFVCLSNKSNSEQHSTMAHATMMDDDSWGAVSKLGMTPNTAAEVVMIDAMVY